MKIILKQEHFEKLHDILEESLAAHQRAHWGNSEAREVIINIIIKKFKSYLGIS